MERGLSLPDIALLEPLADILGVTVAELLKGERIHAALEPQEMDELLGKPFICQTIKTRTFWFSQKLSMTGSEGEAYDSIERKSRTTAAGGTAEKSRTVGRPLQNGGALRGKNRSRVW